MARLFDNINHSFEDLFNFDYLMRIKIKGLIGKYIVEFEDDEEKGNGLVSMQCIYAYPLIEQLRIYYNNELAVCAAVSKVICNSKRKNKRVKAFHLENTFTRIISMWDYIFGVINEYLQLELIADQQLKEQIIEESIVYKIPVYYNDGMYSLDKIPMEEEKQKEIRKKLNKELKVISPKILIDTYRSKYTECKYIDDIYKLYNEESIKQLKKVRNQVIHRSTLGADFNLIVSDIFNAQALSGNTWSSEDINQFVFLIDDNMKIIGLALTHLYNFVSFDYYPNRIENINKEYNLYYAKCQACNEIICYPEEIIKISTDDLMCTKCSSFEITIERKVKVNEPVYEMRLINYIEDLRESIERELNMDEDEEMI